MSSWVLVGITAVYVVLTYLLLRENRRQAKRLSNPVLGIKPRRTWLGETTISEDDDSQHPMVIFTLELQVVNMSTAPAMNIRVDAELSFPESGTSSGPFPLAAPFNHPYLVAEGETIGVRGIGGKACDELRSAVARQQSQTGLEKTGIELTVYAYYMNHASEWFRSTYKASLQPQDPKQEWGNFKETRLPGSTFVSEEIGDSQVTHEIIARDKLRKRL